MKYYLDTRTTLKNGASPLKLRVSLNGESTIFGTGIAIPRKDWNAAAERVKSSNPDHYALNVRLRDFKDKADDYILQLRLAGRLAGMDIGELRKEMALRVFSQAERRKGTDLFLARLVAYRDKQRKKGTWSVYNSTIVTLRAFDDKLERRTFKNIDYGYLARFENWCYDVKNLKPNSISIHLRNIRTVFNEALDDEIITCYPFRKFRIRQEATRKRCLTLEQLHEIFTCDLEPWQVEYVDMFKLMIYLIGINAADLFGARPSALDHGRLNYRRRKTGKLYSIKVEPGALEIIRKYKGKNWLLSPLDHYSDYKDYLHHLNDGLKTIGRVTGKQGKVIEEGPFNELSSYWARHTWATIAYQIGIPVDTIGQALGHSDKSHAVTFTYIKSDEAKVDEANRKVLDHIFRNKDFPMDKKAV